MAGQTKLYLLAIILLVVSSNLPNFIYAVDDSPCYFIFGDSYVDNGNNNDLDTVLKANFKPYGVDFKDGPTGRFTNGKTIADFIAEQIGLNAAVLAFAKVGDDSKTILQGVNYASAGAGIRKETASKLGNVVSLNQQLKNHRIVTGRLNSSLGGDAASLHLEKCLYTVVIGNSDYMNNFNLEKSASGQKYNAQQFATELVDQRLDSHLKTLLKLGARKIALFGVGRLGCSPAAVAISGKYDSTCVESLNDNIKAFNERMKKLVDSLNQKYTTAYFTFIDTYNILSEKSTFAFQVIDSPCCQKTSKEGLCLPDSAICQNATAYFYWDMLHPSEAVNKMIAERAMTSSGNTDAQPYNIADLIKLKPRKN